MVAADRRAGVWCAPAGHMPYGERSEEFGDQYGSSRARREESVSVRWEQFCHVRARAADDDDSGAGISRGGPDYGAGEARRAPGLDFCKDPDPVAAAGPICVFDFQPTRYELNSAPK